LSQANISIAMGNGADVALAVSDIVILNDKQLAVFELEDTIREDAIETIQALKKQKIRVIICSGDNQNIVQKISKEVGIDEYKFKMSPTDKVDFIKKLQNNGDIVLMAGDGINDALALSQANISIAMGNGADVALAVSDIVILNDKLYGIVKSLYISTRTFNFIKMNLTISLMYNIITIPLALLGYVIPFVAALSMSLSSLLVIGNSMRIKNNKFKRK
jgi:Cu+-exporting ATPase